MVLLIFYCTWWFIYLFTNILWFKSLKFVALNDLKKMDVYNVHVHCIHIMRVYLNNAIYSFMGKFKYWKLALI
jgi:hypothetical protein